MVRDPTSRVLGPSIHPTAVVHPTAHLDDGVEIGPYAVIGGRTTIGVGTVVGSHAIIHGGVEIGRNNQIAAHAAIGVRPQDRAYRDEPTRVVIGDGNIISGFASIERATGEGLETRIGNGAYIMSCVKVAHNCRLGDGVTIVSGSQIGGWVHIGEHAYIGGISGVHQYVHIGRLVMVAGLSAVRQDVPPYVMVAGFRARAVSLNKVGLERHGVPSADRLALRRAFRIFFQSGLSMAAALKALDDEAGRSAAVQEFLGFVRAARERDRGIVRWRAETAS